jgi:glycine oxidase
VQLLRPVRLLHHRHPIYIVPRAQGVFMIGATTIESDTGGGVSLRSAGELLTLAYSLHPAFAEAEILELNAGLRPAFPDHRPQIRVRGRHLFVNGLYRHGFLLAPALAEQVVHYLRSGAADPEVIHAY